jgi:hypothetical protein
MEDRVAMHVDGVGVLLRVGTRLFLLRYVDDSVLMARTADGLQLMLDEIVAMSREQCFDFSAEKTEIMRVGSMTAPDPPMRAFFMNGELLKETDKFRYLGLVQGNRVPMGPAAGAMVDLREQEARQKVYGPLGHARSMLLVASRDRRLTNRECLALYTSYVRGLFDYCPASTIRSFRNQFEDVQTDCLRIMGHVSPKEAGYEIVSLQGDLGLPSIRSYLLASVIRQWIIFEKAPVRTPRRDVLDHARIVWNEHGRPQGHFLSVVQAALAEIGKAEYFEGGWPGTVAQACAELEVVIKRYRQRHWWERVVGNGYLAPRRVLHPLYVRIKRVLETDEYQTEGSSEYRSYMARFRSDQMPTKVVLMRRLHPKPPRALRYCTDCVVLEAQDTMHVLTGCGAHAVEIEAMVAAVRSTGSPELLEWLGDIGGDVEHRLRWCAVFLDGAIEGGVPFAAAYGRNKRAIRHFRDFRLHRREYMAVWKMRAALRRALRKYIMIIGKRLMAAAGYRHF